MSRILMTTDTAGGVFAYALDLAKALSARDIETVLVALGTPSEGQRRDAAAIDGLALVARDVPLEWMEDPWDSLDNIDSWLLDVAVDCAPDIVHLNHFAHGHLSWPAPVVMVAHSCVLSWFEAVRHTAAPPAWDEYRRRVRRGLAGADLVIAPSRWMSVAAARHYGPFRREATVYNGCDLALPANDAADRGARDGIVFACGRLWDDAKNTALLAAAADRLEWPVVIAGPASPSNGAPADGAPAETSSHPPPVRRLPLLTRAEIAGWMRRAALYVLPVRYEPFGLSILEAAQAGCAVVVGDIPSQREIWSDAATFVDPDDAAGLARAVNALIDSPERLADMRARARARAGRYTLSAMADSYIAHYRSLIAA